MTPYIAWMGLPCVVLAALWCSFVAEVVEHHARRAFSAGRVRRTRTRQAMTGIRAAFWRQRMGVAE